MAGKIITIFCGVLFCLVVFCPYEFEAKEISRSIESESEDGSLGESFLFADQCTGKKCLNGGKCHINAGKALCKCTDRYTGDTCQTDKCKNKCLNGGSCYIKAGKALCKCTDSFTGDRCQTNKCSTIKCNNGGKCVIKSLKVTCSCTERFTGDTCQTDKCSAVKCLNGGICHIKDGKPLCNCTKDYTGPTCQTITNVSFCSSDPCANGGTCTEDLSVPTFNCTCAEGYVGDRCLTMDLCVQDDDGEICKNGACVYTKDGLSRSCYCFIGDYWDDITRECKVIRTVKTTTEFKPTSSNIIFASTTHPPLSTVKEFPSTPAPKLSTRGFSSIAPTTWQYSTESTRVTTTSPTLELIKSLVVKILIYEEKI